MQCIDPHIHMSSRTTDDYKLWPKQALLRLSSQLSGWGSLEPRLKLSVITMQA